MGFTGNIFSKYRPSNPDMTNKEKRSWRIYRPAAALVGALVLYIVVSSNNSTPPQSHFCGVAVAQANEGSDSLADTALNYIGTEKIDPHKVGFDINREIFDNEVVPLGVGVAVCTNKEKSVVTEIFEPSEMVSEGLYEIDPELGTFVKIDQSPTQQN